MTDVLAVVDAARSDAEVARLQDRHAEASSTMTIQTARDLFLQYGEKFRPDCEAVVSLVRKRNLSDALPNSNYLHALSLTQLMLDHTDHEFRMLTGCAGDGFLSSLKSSFVEMLRRIRDVKGTARIIFVNDNRKSEWIDSLRKEFPDTLDTVSVRAATNLSHFIVCDDDMVRDEELHDALTEQSSANLIKAKVFFKNLAMAEVFSVRFDAIWKGVSGRK